MICVSMFSDTQQLPTLVCDILVMLIIFALHKVTLSAEGNHQKLLQDMVTISEDIYH